MISFTEGIVGLWDTALADYDRVWKRTLLCLLLCAVMFLYPFGVVFVAGGFLPQHFSWTASVVIALNALTVLVSEFRTGSVLRPTVLCGGVIVLLFGVELVGARTGLPFGTYSYTGVLGFAVLGVPVAISYAWYATIVSSLRIAALLMESTQFDRRGVVALAAGLFCLSLDIVLEPVASHVTRYWVWAGGEVPPENYLSWFVISTGAAYVLTGTGSPASQRRESAGIVSALVYGTQFSLFAAAGLVHGWYLPSLVATIVVAVLVVGLRLLSLRVSDRRVHEQ